MHMTLVAGGEGGGGQFTSEGDHLLQSRLSPGTLVHLLCDSVTFCLVFRLPHISLLPPLHVLSTNSEAEKRETGMSVYIGSVIDISVSVVGGHVIMCHKPELHV